MPLPDSDAPFSGGFVPGGRIFAVDGDFATWSADGPPDITPVPMEGDSIFSGRDIVYLGGAGSAPGNWLTQKYVRIPLGAFPNLQPWFPNQDSIIIRQRFVGAFSTFQPMRLNTPYDPAWAEPWQGSFLDDLPSVELSDAILVREEGPRPIEGGLAEVTRIFSTIPKSRSIVEQFGYNYIGLNDRAGGTNIRPRKVKAVNSRLQFDYFVFDDFPVLSTPLFPDGNRLDSTTGINPPGLLLLAQEYYGSEPYSEVNQLEDESELGANDQTIPSLTEYIAFLDQSGSGGPSAAELVAEASCMRQYMGNIYERVTRFVQAQ